MGLIDTVALAGTLVLALPIAMLGVEFAIGGDLLRGVGFVAVAAMLVAGQHYLGVPSLKRRLAGTALERLGGGGDAETIETDDPEDRDGATVEIRREG